MNAQEARQALVEVMKVFPKKKIPEFFGIFNDLDLFLAEMERKGN